MLFRDLLVQRSDPGDRFLSLLPDLIALICQQRCPLQIIAIGCGLGCIVSILTTVPIPDPRAMLLRQVVIIGFGTLQRGILVDQTLQLQLLIAQLQVR